MKTLAQIREHILSLTAEAEAIQALCQAENREPKDDEKKRLDEILDKEIVTAREDLARAEKLQTIKAASLAKHGIGAEHTTEGNVEAKKPSIVPANCKRHGKLKAFKGNDGERNAYAFGQWFLGMLGNEKSKAWATDHGYEFRNCISKISRR